LDFRQEKKKSAIQIRWYFQKGIHFSKFLLFLKKTLVRASLMTFLSIILLLLRILLLDRPQKMKSVQILEILDEAIQKVLLEALWRPLLEVSKRYFFQR